MEQTFEVKIKSAKLIEKGEGLGVAYTRLADKDNAKVTEEHPSSPVHGDLKTAMDNLRVHLALLTTDHYYAAVSNIETPPETLTDKFVVNGYSLGKNAENPGVVISGHFILNGGKVVILNTPFTLLNEAQETGYKYLEDLQAKLDRLDEEVRDYLFESKRAQLDLFNQKPDPVTNIVIDHPEAEYAGSSEAMAGQIDYTKGGNSAPVKGPEDVAKQIVESTNKVVNTGNIPHADPEAMGRVAQMKNTSKKKVAQSADAPSGEVANG